MVSTKPGDGTGELCLRLVGLGLFLTSEDMGAVALRGCGLSLPLAGELFLLGR